jgi:FkbM family methyltransferase
MSSIDPPSPPGDRPPGSRGDSLAAIGRRALSGARRAVYEIRYFGVGAYARYRWRRARMPDQPQPEANRRFELGSGVAIVPPESCLVGLSSHFVDQGRGTDELDALRRLAPGHSTFLDIGAAYGLFAAAFCALTGSRAYGFEPSPEMFDHMGELVAANPDLQIVPVKVGLGSFSGTVTVTRSANDQFRAATEVGSDVQEMSVEPLDAFVHARQIVPDFAKVDVEGMELEVLRGGAATFSAPALDALLLEVHPNILGNLGVVAELERLLRDFGFELYTLAFEPITGLADQIAKGPPAARRATNLIGLKNPPR